MNDASHSDFPSLKSTTIAVLIGAILVAASYAFVDRPAAYFVHDHGVDRDVVLKWFTYPPPIVQNWTPLLFAILVVRRAWGPWARWQWTLLLAAIALLIADQFRVSLAYVFGRTWPETWIDNNPSLIGDGVFGFHPFHGGPGYESFPSGHTARTAAVLAVFWGAYPRGRWVCILATGLVAVGLVGMNYHFVGDVVGGLFIGMIVGRYVAAFGPNARAG